MRILGVAFIALTLGGFNVASGLEIQRPVRHWEFMSAVGPHAALLGHETGEFEAWVYPVKLLTDFRLEFKLNGRVIPSRSVVRSVIYRPGSTTLIYSGDYYAEHFLVRQTLIVPPDLQGALIRLSIESSAPLTLDASFQRDFTLMWPAGLGGTNGGWDDTLNAYLLSEETGQFLGVVGSPDARLLERDYGTNYSASDRTVFSLGTLQGQHQRAIALAASFQSREDLQATYSALLNDPEALERRTEQHYREYLEGVPRLMLPEERFEQAYQWSMLSMVKGLVENPFMEGRGLVAGFGLSKGAPRPGFAWFFGRDTFWSTLALTAGGDLESARDAIRFIAQYQRDDGKIPHEISQAAPFIPWFEKYPYAYASADATALYVIAVADYVAVSGDRDFLRESWPRLTKAIDFLQSVSDPSGFARNQDVGHGWVEGGPLLPVRTEFYQAGLHVEALRAIADLARFRQDQPAAIRFRKAFLTQREKLEETYWLEGSGRYAFAIGLDGQPVDEPGVLATVPMWFGLLQPERARRMAGALSSEDHLSDWGSRIISSRSSHYGPAGYHFGSVWPLFTGWASVGEYRYHAAHPAFANLAANVALALDGSGGNTTEVISGAVYSPLSTSSSHQIWSAAMIVSPLMRGLLGLDVDASARQLTLQPHLPADWNGFEIRGFRVGTDPIDLALERSAQRLTLKLANHSQQVVRLRFSPALAPSARLEAARYQGTNVQWQRQEGGQDWHPILDLTIAPGESVVELEVRGDFGVTAPAPLPGFGQPSSNLKILAEEWTEGGKQVEILVSGRPGRRYVLHLRGAGNVKDVEGANVEDDGALSLSIPDAPTADYQEHRITIRLNP